MRWRPIRLPALVLALGAAVLTAGCGSTTASTAPASPATPTPVPAATGAPSNGPGMVELQVYAAASLKNVLVELAAAYEAARPGTTLAVSTDSSAALATKISEGAPADLFLSADTRNPQKLADAGLAGSPVVIFAGNELALIVPEANAGQVTALSDLAKPGLKVVAAGAEVPVTGYTSQLLEKLAALDGYPDDFAARYEANVVSREDNVGAIAAKVSLGEGDAGIVYGTDARTAKDIQVIPIPADLNVAARYGAITVKDAPNAEAATAFLAWLTTQEAQDILAAFGFKPVA